LSATQFLVTVMADFKPERAGETSPPGHLASALMAERGLAAVHIGVSRGAPSVLRLDVDARSADEATRIAVSLVAGIARRVGLRPESVRADAIAEDDRPHGPLGVPASDRP